MSTHPHYLTQHSQTFLAKPTNISVFAWQNEVALAQRSAEKLSLAGQRWLMSFKFKAINKLQVF